MILTLDAVRKSYASTEGPIDILKGINLSVDQRALYRRTKVGLVFQQFNLIPSLTVAANISFHAKLAKRHDSRWESKLIDALGLEQYTGRYPEQLSGGQQQRVAIGRTLAGKPRLILADEPTGNLDEQTGDAVLDLMLGLGEKRGIGAAACHTFDPFSDSTGSHRPASR